MPNKDDAYAQRGVSSGKEEVHEAAKIFDKGLFPNTFCKILPDVLTGDPDYCLVMHGDGAGTKVILPYLHWKETGDLSKFKTIVEDALVMNLDDMAAAGIVDNFVINSTIDRNAFAVPGEVLSQLMIGTQEFIDHMKDHGVTINHSGGETADLGDIVRTFTCNFTIVARAKRSDIIQINIKPGDRAIGFSSYGIDNSGIGANGLTSARHDLLGKVYKDDYPECYDKENVDNGNIPEDLIYCGDYEITDPEVQGLADPTRSYLPFLKALKEEGLLSKLSGVIHNTGGAHSKVLKFVDGVSIQKEFSDDLPEIFSLIQQTRNDSWENMFKTFNMGVRLEIYGDVVTLAQAEIVGRNLGLSPIMYGEVNESEEKFVAITHNCIGSKDPIYLR